MLIKYYELNGKKQERNLSTQETYFFVHKFTSREGSFPLFTQFSVVPKEAQRVELIEKYLKVELNEFEAKYFTKQTKKLKTN